MPQQGPSLPPQLLEKRKRSDTEDADGPPSHGLQSLVDTQQKKQRTVGPTLPLHLQGSEDGNSSCSDSDDAFGPALPFTGKDTVGRELATSRTLPGLIFTG